MNPSGLFHQQNLQKPPLLEAITSPYQLKSDRMTLTETSFLPNIGGNTTSFKSNSTFHQNLRQISIRRAQESSSVSKELQDDGKSIESKLVDSFLRENDTENDNMRKKYKPADVITLGRFEQEKNFEISKKSFISNMQNGEDASKDQNDKKIPLSKGFFNSKKMEGAKNNEDSAIKSNQIKTETKERPLIGFFNKNKKQSPDDPQNQSNEDKIQIQRNQVLEGKTLPRDDIPKTTFPEEDSEEEKAIQYPKAIINRNQTESAKFLGNQNNSGFTPSIKLGVDLDSKTNENTKLERRWQNNLNQERKFEGDMDHSKKEDQNKGNNNVLRNLLSFKHERKALEPSNTNILKDFLRDPEAFFMFQEMYRETFKNMERLQDPEKMLEFLKKAERRRENEQKRKEQALPIYSKREEIMKQINTEKFSIVVGDTGCGKSTQLPQYLFEYYEQIPGSKILWVLPRKLPTLSLSQRVSNEMDIAIGQEVGYEIPSKNICSSKTILKFVTDTVLINQLIEKRAEAGPNGKIKLDYSIIVLDEVHERNLYTDILLAALKKIAIESQMKMLITSATINESLFENYFETKAIRVKGHPYPIEIEYNPLPDSLSPVVHMANTIFNVVKEMQTPGYNYKGHILLFTSGVDDIVKVTSELLDLFDKRNINIDKYEILPLHGLLAPNEQDAVFHDVGKTKIILSTRIAETALTINGVRVVIDIGYDKETMYDAIKRMTIVENRPIPQSSAIQRAGRAGRTSPGLCIRLYSVEEYERLSRNKASEIQRMNIGKVILKLKALGVGNLRQFDFIEKPREEVLIQTIEHLIELGALSKEDESLTPIGQAMLKLETDPDFSKVILEGLKRGCEQEVIDIIGMIGVNSFLFRRGFDDETKEASDRQKLGFCHKKGDLLTLLGIYRYWFSLEKPQRRIWCEWSFLNYNALNEAFKTTMELKKNLDVVQMILKSYMPSSKALQEQIKTEQEEENQEVFVDYVNHCNEKEDQILKCFLTAFYPNVCLYTNIPRVGYTLLRDNMTLRLHGASSLSLVQDYPKYLFCIDINKTGYNNSKIVSIMKQEWLEELFPQYQDNPRLKFLTNSYTLIHYVIPKLSRQILGHFLYKRLPEIQAISDLTETTFFPELNEEKLHIYSSDRNRNQIQQKFHDIINIILDEFENEVREVPIVLKTRGIFENGGKVKELLFGDETLTLSFDGFKPSYNESNIQLLFERFGDVVSVFVEIDKETNLLRGVVNMTKSGDVKKALEFLDEYRLREFKEPKSKIEPKIIPISYKLGYGAKRALRLRIEWFLGESRLGASLRFENAECADQVFEGLEKLKPILDGSILEVLEFGESEDGAFVRRCKDKKKLIIKNLNPLTDEIDIERFFRSLKLDKGLLGVTVFRDDQFNIDGLDKMPPNAYLDIIRQTIVEKLGIEESQIYRIEPRHPKPKQPKSSAEYQYTEFKRRVEVDVFDLEIAKKIIAHFDGNTNFELLTQGRMHCSLTFSRRYVLRRTKYQVIEKDLNELTTRLKETKGGGIAIFKEKIDNTFDRNSSDVGIRVITSDPLTLDECCNAITPLVQGSPFYLKTFMQYRKIETQNAKDSIEMIEQKNNVTIEYDKRRRKLKVFGPQEDRNKALNQLQALFNEVPKEMQKATVKFRYRPIRHILQNNGAVLMEVEQLYGVEITYSLISKEIVIYGKAENVLRAEKEVKDLVNSCINKESANENECPICMEQFINGYRLQLCGHKFCFSCLEAEMNEKLSNSPEFPLSCSLCFNDGKKIPICIRDLSNIFPAGGIQTLWDRSIEAHLLQNSEKYFRCFSPNCLQIFRVSSQKWFDCDYCLKSYCKECKKEAHGESACENIRAKDLVIFQENDFKECPNCNSIIERKGCSKKMKCIICSVIFCWICTEIFGSTAKVYDHLHEVHQAFGAL